MEKPKKKVIVNVQDEIPRLLKRTRPPVEEKEEEQPASVPPAVISAEKQQEEPEKRLPGRPFKPGQSGNPNGRPRGSKSITSLVYERLQEKDPATGKTNIEMMIQQILKNALIGDMDFIKLIWNYIDGKPNQPMDHTHHLGAPDPEVQSMLDAVLQKNR